jgi:hypothetical protein
MRRTKLVLAVASAIVMMLALTAGPALADENDHQRDRLDNGVLVDNLCRPGAPDSLFIPGCVLTGDLFNDNVVPDDVLVSDLDHSLLDLDHVDHAFAVDRDNILFGDIDHTNHNGNDNNDHHGGDHRDN